MIAVEGSRQDCNDVMGVMERLLEMPEDCAYSCGFISPHQVLRLGCAGQYRTTLQSMIQAQGGSSSVVPHSAPALASYFQLTNCTADIDILAALLPVTPQPTAAPTMSPTHRPTATGYTYPPTAGCAPDTDMLCSHYGVERPGFCCRRGSMALACATTCCEASCNTQATGSPATSNPTATPTQPTPCESACTHLYSSTHISCLTAALPQKHD